MIPRDLQIDFPGAAYLFIGGIVLFFLYWRLMRYREKVTKVYSASPSLQKLLVPRSRFYSWLKIICLLFCWLGVTFALMQPKGRGRWVGDEEDKVRQQQIVDEEDEKEVLVRRKAHEVLFLLDTSASMDVADTRIGKSRLEYAKEIIEEMITHLDGQAAALYAFTSEMATVVPATHDYLFFRLMLRQVGINEGDVAGTDLMNALAVMQRKHFSAKSEKLKTLVLLTDGGDTRLERLSGEPRARELEAIISRVSGAEENQLRVFCVGLGTEEGAEIPDIIFEGKPVRSSLDEELLQQLSSQGRGRYYFANAYSSLVLAQDFLDAIGQDDPFHEERTFQRCGKVERTVEADGEQLFDLYFQVPLAMALIALGVVLVLPSVRKKMIVLTLLLPTVLFGENIQQTMHKAEASFEAELYDQAIVQYRQLLKQTLPMQQRATIGLNLGTALLANGQYPEAVRQYRSIELGEDPSPLLRRRLSLYLAIALTEEARMIEEFLDEGDEGFEGDIDHAIKSLQEAFEAINIANEADHELAIIEGRETSYPGIEEIRKAAKRLLVSLTVRRDQHMLSKLTAETGLSRLIAYSLSRIDELERLSSHKHVEQHLRYFAEQEQGHQKLWDRVADTLTEKSDLFQQVTNHHLRGVDLLYEGELWQARQAFAEELLGLKVLLAEETGKDVLEMVLRDRMLVRKRQEQTEGFLKLDDKRLSQLALKLVEALHDKFAEEDQHLMVGLSHQLIERLEKSEVEDTAVYDYVSYQQMKMSETEALLLLDRGGDHWRLQALLDRFELRKLLEKDEEDRFDTMIHLLNQRKITEALIFWAPKEFVVAKLKMLLEAYTVESLSSLSEKHHKVEKIVSKVIAVGGDKTFLSVAEELQRARRSLDAAINASEDVAIIFLEDAKDHDLKALQLFEEQKPHKPEAILKAALTEQERVLKITQLVLAVEPSKRSQELRKIVYGPQKNVLDIADDFLPTLNEQLQQEDGGQQCQINPWNDVVPLFHQGYDEADAAKNSVDWNEMELHQDHAVHAWRDALEKLKQPPEQPPSEQQKEQEQQPQQQNQVLQTLLEMEKEDQITPKKIPIPKKGLRPW